MHYRASFLVFAIQSLSQLSGACGLKYQSFILSNMFNAVLHHCNIIAMLAPVLCTLVAVMLIIFALFEHANF